MQRAPFMHGFDMHDLYTVTYIHTNTRVYHIRINNIQQDCHTIARRPDKQGSRYRFILTIETIVIRVYVYIGIVISM